MKRMRTILAVGLIFCGLGLLGTNVALAQEHGAAPAATETQAATPAIPPTLFGAIGAGIGAGLVVMGGAAGIGRIGGSAVESMARQPEVAGSINMAMLITAAMVEGATLFGVIVCLMFALK